MVVNFISEALLLFNITILEKYYYFITIPCRITTTVPLKVTMTLLVVNDLYFKL